MQQAVGASAAPRTRSQFEPLSTLRIPLWIAGAYVLLTTKVDPDLFGHLRFGLDLLRSGHLSSADPYSFTSDMPWTNHEWLSELTMAVAYSAAGVVGLVVMKGLVAAAVFAVVVKATKEAAPRWRWPGALLAVLGMLPLLLTVRPQIWTLLFLALTCWILTGSSWRRRYWLPALFVLWANMHGGWLVGMGIVGVWSAFELFEPSTSRPPLPVVIALPAACLVATLINPYGWHLWEFLARTVSLTRADIQEWQPLWKASAGSAIHWVAALVWAGLAIRFAEQRRWKAIAAVAILAYGSLRVLRLVPLLAPAAVVLLIPYVRQRVAHAQRSGGPTKAVIDLVFACVGLGVGFWPLSPGCIQVTGTWLPDIQAARAIAAADRTGRLVTPFNWGEYAIWHFGPKLKVSMDGRRETVYSERVVQEQQKVAGGDPDALSRLQVLSPDYAWLSLEKTDRAKRWFVSHGYRIDVSTAHSFVAVRRDLPTIPAAAAATLPPCFPGI